MKKFILISFCIISMCITSAIVVNTYSKYSEDASGSFEKVAGNWVIKLNSQDITQNNTYEFLIENIVLEENSNVLDGKLAPGRAGYFDIQIDPEGTDVSVRYDITIHDESITNNEFVITNVEELNENELIQTDSNTYTGIILFSDVEQSQTNTIRIHFQWNNNVNNDAQDSEMGSILNNVLELPITVDASQYLGETISEYND